MRLVVRLVGHETGLLQSLLSDSQPTGTTSRANGM